MNVIEGNRGVFDGTDAAGTHSTAVSNSIVYGNFATVGNENWYGGSYAYSCTAPLPAGAGNLAMWESGSLGVWRPEAEPSNA